MKLLQSNWFMVWLLALLVIGIAAFAMKNVVILGGVFAVVMLLIFARIYVNFKHRN